MQGPVWELYFVLSIRLNLVRCRVQCVFRLWQDSHKSTQGWKVSFWGSVRGNSVRILKWTNLLGIFFKMIFTPAVTSCYRVHALNADAHLPATLLCYFRCKWCRTLAAVNCTLHWIVLTLPTLQMGITLIILRSCMVTAQSQNLHKLPQKRIVTSHQSLGRRFMFCVLCSKNSLMEPVGYQQCTFFCVKDGIRGWNFASMWIVFIFVELFSFMWIDTTVYGKWCFVFHVYCCVSCMVSTEHSTKQYTCVIAFTVAFRCL